jgi:hypothetical protein
MNSEDNETGFYAVKTLLSKHLEIQSMPDGVNLKLSRLQNPDGQNNDRDSGSNSKVSSPTSNLAHNDPLATSQVARIILLSSTQIGVDHLSHKCFVATPLKMSFIAS